MTTRPANGNDSDTNTIHLSLQGKGGVGKSLTVSILAQYLISRGIVVRCIDRDPVNRVNRHHRPFRIPRKVLTISVS
jgi:nitrogenase subunit NifH